jgi:hypothetical protein
VSRGFSAQRRIGNGGIIRAALCSQSGLEE